MENKKTANNNNIKNGKIKNGKATNGENKTWKINKKTMKNKQYDKATTINN